MPASVILRTATRFLVTLLLLFSVFLLLRGHHHPGGGFVGGLVLTAAFALYAIAYDVAAARQALAVDPRTLMAAGLLVALGSGALGLVLGDPFLTGLWREIDIPGFGALDLGTPLLFDVGVYLTVIGSALTIILALEEE